MCSVLNVIDFSVLVLPTAIVKIFINDEFIGLFRAMCDTGSQANLLIHKAVKYNTSTFKAINGDVIGISANPVRIRKTICASIQPWFSENENDRFSTNFWILPKSSKWSPTLPERNIPCAAISEKLPSNLADPNFWKSDEVSVLLGIDVWIEIMEGMSYKIAKRVLVQESKLGNLISGKFGNENSFSSHEFEPRKSVYTVSINDLNKTIQKFWESEELSLGAKKNVEHELVEAIFEKAHYRDKDGKHVVKIPLNPAIDKIGSSRAVALRRFHALEKRLQKDEEIREQYVEFMREYERLGHMVEAFDSTSEDEQVYYIPHHCVVTSEKFRTVFDASCVTDKGVSLNQVQLECPKLQRDLCEILMRMRRHPVAFSADIKKMFRQIKIVPEQWNLQRIFWREHPKEQLKEYCLVVVTYGLATSPYLAVKSMINGAIAMEKEYPQAAHIIKNDFYMDDGITGAKSKTCAINLAKEVKFVLSKSGFELCKFRSNCKELVRALEGDEAASVLFDDKGQTSVLGLKWLTTTDEFTYIVKNSEIEEELTKRLILSKIGQLYDPNGFIAPVITRAKILMQTIWKANINWDCALPKSIEKEWNALWKTIKHLEQIRIPRWFRMKENVHLQFHGFCDSSKDAFGSVIYIRAIEETGAICCFLIAAKSRVAPLNTVSIPRLELAACELLSVLFDSVRNALELKSIPYFLWSDSTIALQWINKGIHELKIFVANRVKKIRNVSEAQNWHHVRTNENPADLVSRGISADEIVHNNLWWHGSSWLCQEQSKWPKPISIGANSTSPECRLEMKVHSITTKRNELHIFMSIDNGIPCSVRLLDYSNNLSKLVRIMAYVMRFCNRCKIIKNKKESYQKPSTSIDLSKTKELVELPTEEEKVSAYNYFIKKEQEFYYQLEYQYFLHKQEENAEHMLYPENSKIVSLRPFMDKEKMIRMGGRIGKADISYDMKHPFIVPPNTRLSWLIVTNAHEKTLHGSVQIMMQFVRQNLWIPRLRNELRARVHKCVVCKRYNATFENQLMADLPADRVNPNKPFLITGVDYAGPLDLVERYKTRTSKRKAWIAVFVCMVTRAVHLDVVEDLSSAAFIGCFVRFVGRRGQCKMLYSDNGTTFVGADKEFQKAYKNWTCPENLEILNDKMGTKWRFMTPAAPHQGGIYEAAVKSMKYHLRRLIGSKCYTYVHLYTTLVQIEAVVNSRPLYPLSDDATDVQALTPAHFLIGQPFTLPPPISVPTQTNNSLKRIRMEQQKIINSFWERWQNEYLLSLSQRKKWVHENEHVNIGKLVVIKDENLPPARWLLGRIIKLNPSKDGLVRTVVVRTAKNELTRAVQKLCLLPVETNTAPIEQ